MGRISTGEAGVKLGESSSSLQEKDRVWKKNTHIEYPDTPCIAYMPTLIPSNHPNVGIYGIHGVSGVVSLV